MWRRRGPTGLYECVPPRRNGETCARCSPRCGKEYGVTHEEKFVIARTRSPARETRALPGALEKCVLESWLKRTGIAFADSKSRGDFELRGAMNFHIHSAVFRQ